MALKAGTLDDFANSMAAAMEHALEQIWLDKTGSALPAGAQQDRRMLFVAIAQGVVKHIRDQAGAAFDVDVTVEQRASGPFVTSSGTAAVSGTHSHSVTVTQGSAAGNRVVSDGTATVTLVTTGDLY